MSASILSTHAGCDAAFLGNREQPDVARGARVCAAAQLHAESGNRDHAHAVAVLLAKQRHRARRHGKGGVFHLRDDRVVSQDLLVDDRFDFTQLRRCDRREVREVEAQPVRRHQRSRPASRARPSTGPTRVHEVGRRVVAPRRVPQAFVDMRRHALALIECVGDHRDLVPAGYWAPSRTTPSTRATTVPASLRRSPVSETCPPDSR